MEIFAKILNGLKPLTTFAKKFHLRCLRGSNYVFDIIIICNFIQVYTLPSEFIKTILKAFVKFAGALCPFAGCYFKKQTFEISHTPFWPRRTKTKFYQLLILVILYQYTKNYTVSSICSREIADLKPWNLIGWDHFDLYRNKTFPKTGFV